MTEEELMSLRAPAPSGDHVRVNKSYEGVSLKADIADNTITVVCSTVGTADDRSGDVIFPGAYKKSIAGFLKNGFVAIGHDWDGLPVAMPTTCKEVGQQLVSTATFHSTQEAQDARTVCKERMDAGKSVSLSVGFMPNYANPDGVVYFDKGTDLIAWAKGKGYDMSLFDIPGISKLTWCRAITDIAELFEWSIVGVGMNRGSKATDVKSIQKSQQNTVAAILQAKIHQSFTVAADELAIRGYMTTDQRIALSGAISTALKAFAAEIDPEVANTPIDASDVDWVASKTFDEQFNEALGCLDALLSRWEGIAEKRDALGETHRKRLGAILDRLGPIVAKSHPAPGAEDVTSTPTEDEQKATRFRELQARTLAAKTARMAVTTR